MEMSIRSDLSLPRLASLSSNASKAISTGITKGFTKAVPGMTAVGRAHIGTKLNIKRKSALNGWKAKTLPPQSGKPTALLAQIRQKWLSIHETGGTIKPKSGKFLFVPVVGIKRISYAKLKAAIANKELQIVPENGRLLVFRAGLTPKGKRRKGKLIGYLIKSVKIRKVLDTAMVVTKNSDAVARLVDAEVSAALAALSITNTS